ncbi:hypothetical protein [Bacteroides sp.]|uniref:hypothetical protein n=1 Tax=Bacteroides sp. TaxID=29523 RepID=UPI002613F0BE|nr:hypothetical protein [Bacteroides sp.]MDD3039740.1 hypothetical protein [Bacteroides sp.]
MDKQGKLLLPLIVVIGVIVELFVPYTFTSPKAENPQVKVIYAGNRQNYIDYELPKATKGSFKTFMDYRTITDETSKQYALQRLATTDENGLRKFNNKYIVAMGTYYSHKVGKEFILTLDNSREISVIVGDIKQDIHTDTHNQYASISGNIVEFIVDEDKLSNKVLRTGDVSHLGLQGNITRIEEVIYNGN